MSITFTPQQQTAAELHGSNILVSAAAGSGKTAVLAERIVRMVCDSAHPVDIDRLLVVTFTNAAAAQMRERIAQGIGDRLREEPENEHIQRQSALLPGAQITTIDSFSLFLIRNHFNEIGLDPAFRVADEGEMKLLAAEVLGGLLEEAYASGEERFLHCVEYFCPGGREKQLEDAVLKLSGYAASFPWPWEWLEARKQDYGTVGRESADNETAGSSTGCTAYLHQYIEKMLSGCREKLKEVEKLCLEPDGPYMYGEAVEQELEQLEGLCRRAASGAGELPTISFGRLPSKKDDTVSPQKRELAKELRNQVKATLQKLTEDFFRTPEELADRQAAACAAPVEVLIDLTLEFDRRMREKKQERRIIDFSDMEHYALEILLEREEEEVRPSHVARQYQEYFQEILIDEYQDSNLVQEYLLRAVSGEEAGRYNRFMVGDVKQSIYKFRLARPELFLEKYDGYRTLESDPSCCVRIDLSQNFRSRETVISTVNSLFSRMMSKAVGGVAYDDHAALYPGASYPENQGCETELLLVEKPDGNVRRADTMGAKQAEALAIAGKIKELRQGFLVTDGDSGKLRPVRYSDMVILLRSVSGWDEEFKKILEGEGIPAYVASKTGYFGAGEVQELLNFLRVLDNPFQDIPLYGVLKSVFGGFVEEEIAALRAGHRDLCLYEALGLCAGVGQLHGGEAAAEKSGMGESCAEPVEAALRDKTAAFLKKMNAYRECTAYLPIRDLLQQILNDVDYLDYVTALPAGDRRRANVEMLLTKASDFEKTSYFGLFHFIRYMEQLEKYDVDYGEADTLDENADVVRIMSIHKSKGLEFPVAFVAGLSKRFNMQDANQALLVDMDLGLAVDYVDPERRIRNRTLRRAVLSRKMREDNLAEELRILYVALTRAREKLILSGTLENAWQQWERWQLAGKEKLSYLDFVEAASFFDFLLPVLGTAGVEVKLVGQEALAAAQRKEQLELGSRREMLDRVELLAPVDAAALAALGQRFAYRYPREALAGLYTKTTVSELKIAAMAQEDEAAYHAFEEQEIVPYIPAFRREQEPVSGTVRGNAYHRVMELLDFEGLLSSLFAELPEDYESYRTGVQGNLNQLSQLLLEFLQTQQDSLRLSEEYFAAVSGGKLLHFLESSLAWRMWRAQRGGALYKEKPFVLELPARRLNAEFPEEETVLIQGIVDVFFVENGEITLVDYKTDVIGSLEELRKRYETQVDYYEEALTRLMGLPVKEKILYSFHLEKY